MYAVDLLIVLSVLGLGVISFVAWRMFRAPRREEDTQDDDTKIREFAGKLAGYYKYSNQLAPIKEAERSKEIIVMLRLVPCQEARFLLGIAEKSAREQRYPICPTEGSAEFDKMTSAIGEVLAWMWEYGFPQVEEKAVA